jgi:serine/threonine protein kinase
MTPDSVATDLRAEGDFNVSQVWLDALARGTCDEEAFLRAVQMLTRRSPEAAWDSLALLDQYFRRGKIKADVFKRVKSRLGSQLLGPALDVQISVPLSRQESPQAPPPAPAASAPAPVARPHSVTSPLNVTPRTVTLPPLPVSTPLASASAPSPVPAPAPEMAPPPGSPPSARRGATTAASKLAAVAPSGRTVPIAAESTSIPMPNPANRPVEETERISPRQVTVGDVLRGRYVIKNVLGLGGTGTVFEAIDRYRLDLPDSGQRVAVKVLHTDANKQSAVLTDLRREFQLLQSLSHPNIVRAHEYDRDGDIAFFTMEYLGGLSLESVLSAHRGVALERAHALIIIRDVAAALEHAHSRGVVHGDLNPGNIFITNDGEIRVLDFGAAHTPSQTPSIVEGDWDPTAYATPHYASCQLLDGERADVRDDTYALACVLYVLLAGKRPFGELNAAQARGQRLKPRRPAGLTGKQWHALRSALAFDRQRRPAEIAGWLEPFGLPKPEARLPALLALLKTAPPRSRGSRAAALIVVVAAAVAAAGWWAIGHEELVSQTAGEAGGGLMDALASADAALARLWQEGRDALSSAPAEQPPTAPPKESSGVTVPEGGPSAAIPAEESSTPAKPSVSGSAPAVRLAPPRTAVPGAASSAAALPPRSSAAAQPPRTRIELTADSVDVAPTDPAAHVIVKRTGNLRADASFTWWTESGTAKPGKDFMDVKTHEEHFEAGKAAADLFVPVVADPTRKESKSFYIVINDPSDGASLGKRTLTMVTIPPSE